MFICFQKRYNFAAAHELQVEFLTIVSGKSKIISELMWMRNNEVKRIYKDIIELEIHNWWIDSNFYNERLDFLQKMNKASNELILNTNFNFDENKISKLFELYIKKNYHEKFSKRNFFSKMMDSIIPQIREMKKKLINKYKLKSNNLVGKSNFNMRRYAKDSQLDINKTIKDQFNHLRINDNKLYHSFFIFLSKHFVKYYSS